MAGKKMTKEQKRYRDIALRANQGHRDAIEQVLRGECMDPHDLMGNLAWSNHVEGLRLLLDAGVEPERVNGGGNTLLHMACLGGALEAVQLLIERGANPEARNLKQETPHAMAARSPSLRGTEVARWLEGWARAHTLKPALEAALADPASTAKRRRL